VGIGVILLGPAVGGVMRTMGLGKNEEPLALTPAVAGEEEPRVHANA